MRLSELLGADVVDQAGRSAGHVHDARLVQDGPVIGGFGASLRVEGLIVGRRSIGARLGYERGQVRGPLPVRLLAGWLYRGAGYVHWDRVRAIEPHRIVISGSVADLPAPEPPS
ncbi:MAG TPA: PRC-barrel domain containing protein [Actinomycetes bacterium]